MGFTPPLGVGMPSTPQGRAEPDVPRRNGGSASGSQGQVPPLVTQHLGWLKPAASNKMYNARLVERRSPGTCLEPSGYPKDREALSHNAKALLQLLKRASAAGDFAYQSAAGQRTDPAFFGVSPHAELLDSLSALRWGPRDHFEADLTWLGGLEGTQIEDWAIVLPQHAGSGARRPLFDGRTLSVFRRRRRRDPLFGAISDPKHRHAANRIAGIGDFADPLADSLRSPTRGSIFIYPVVEVDDDAEIPDELDFGDLVTAFSLVAPEGTGSPDGTLVRFVVKDGNQPDEPIVDA